MEELGDSLTSGGSLAASCSSSWLMAETSAPKTSAPKTSAPSSSSAQRVMRYGRRLPLNRYEGKDGPML